MSDSNAEENTTTSALLEDAVASEADKTLSDDDISDARATACTSPPNDDDVPVLVVRVGPANTNPISEHGDLSRKTQTHSCDDCHS